MSRSYQREIPLARVNITLDVETGGAKSKKELPMKMLVLGDFSHGQATGPVGSRELVSITKSNFNQVLADIAPAISFSVPDRISPNRDELPVHLRMTEYASFTPEQLIEQVPALKRLMAMRNLLKDLKSCLIDNQTFRKELEKIVKDSASSQELLQELSHTAPLLQN